MVQMELTIKKSCGLKLHVHVSFMEKQLPDKNEEVTWISPSPNLALQTENWLNDLSLHLL